MASSVRRLQNHYEVLGLSPTASREEVARAFATGMSMFGARPVAAAAQVSHAFEVLRDPVKRREYDRVMGLAPEPEPYKWTFALASERGLPFSTAVATAPSPATPAAAGAEPHVTEAAAEAKRAEDKLASLIQSLRDLSEPTRASVTSQPPPAMEEEAPVVAQPVDAARPRAPQFVTLELADNAGGRDFLRHDWRRPAFVLGGLLVCTAILGAVAGLSVIGGDSSAEAEPAVTVPVPAATTGAATIAEAQEPVAAPTWSAPAPAAAPQKRRGTSRSAAMDSAAPSVGPADTTRAAEPVEIAESDPLAPQADAAPAVTARLPLPNAVIARTIGRIGYACGSVASATAVQGAPGTFNVTCTSGHSYRAAPVRGRYRFKRLG